ncbi:hypothetical protein [Paraburkholderia dipogonis]|uniref:hypothetical protein n=1 Tax=Paraburkholderia dipogonis TaxID=1211383 RepID=UPI0038B91E9A
MGKVDLIVLLLLAALVCAACGKSSASQDAIQSGDQGSSVDPIYAAAVDAAAKLRPECRMIGQAMIRMATPRPGVSDYVREKQLENTAGHVPDACIIGN